MVRLEVAPHLEKVVDGAPEIIGVHGKGPGVHRARRGAADDLEGIHLGVGQHLLQRLQDAHLIGGAGATAREHDSRLAATHRFHGPPEPGLPAGYLGPAAVLPFSLRTGVPAVRAFCNISAAWRRVASVILRPPSMRATSATRSSASRVSTVASVPRAPGCLATRSCARACTATCGRCVTERTWWCFARVCRRRPTTSATAPPIPASTSSKTSVGTDASPERSTWIASERRESSPPEATLASGASAWPSCAATRSSTDSRPPAAGGPHGSC